MEFVKLSNIATINAGGTPSRSKSKYWNGNIPWLKISDIKSKYTNLSTEFITEEGLNNSSAKYFDENTVLYTIFATVGEVSILNFKSTTNQAIAGIKLINNNYITEYLYFYLRSIKNKVKFDSKGVAQNNINLAYLKNLDIPVITIEKQYEIVRNLNEIEELIEKNNSILLNLDNIVKSQFIEMFGDINSGEFKYEKIMLKDVCEKKSSNLQINKLEDNDGIYPLYGASGLVKTIDFYCSDSDYLGVVKDGSGVGKIFFLEKHSSLVGTMEYIYPNDKITIRFLEHTMKNLDLADSVSGVAIPHIYFKNYSKKYISLPPKNMQFNFENLINQIDKSKYFGGVNYGIC